MQCEPGEPWLALLDWMMPGVDGPAVIRVVRSEEGMPYVHMILLTSRQSKDDLIAGLEAGADDFFTKPLYPEGLVLLDNLQRPLPARDRKSTRLKSHPQINTLCLLFFYKKKIQAR